MSCVFNEDDYRDQQLDKYLAEQEMAEPCSTCCGAPIIEDTDICMECLEHCCIVEMGEFMFEVHASHEEDKADEERERMREEL